MLEDLYLYGFKPWRSPSSDLINLYYALIRSILEYCSKLWNYAMLRYLSDELEKGRKRAIRIIFPDHSYDEALQLANCTRRSNRRDKMCITILEKSLSVQVHYLNTLQSPRAWFNNISD